MNPNRDETDEQSWLAEVMLETAIKAIIYGAVALVVATVISIRAPQSLAIDEINDSLGGIRSAINNVDTSANVDLDTSAITAAINRSGDDITIAIQDLRSELASIDRELCRALSNQFSAAC